MTRLQHLGDSTALARFSPLGGWSLDPDSFCNPWVTPLVLTRSMQVGDSARMTRSMLLGD